MGKLIIVSNRLPLTVSKKKSKFTFQPSVGGLVTGISSLDMGQEQVWIGWPGITLSGYSAKSDSKELKDILAKDNYLPVFLKRADFENYYQGFCNEIIWPLFHYFVQYANYEKSYWDSYKRVNEAFSKAVLEVANEDDVIWVHDYHLMLLPALIRKKTSKSKNRFFSTHTVSFIRNI